MRWSKSSPAPRSAQNELVPEGGGLVAALPARNMVFTCFANHLYSIL